MGATGSMPIEHMEGNMKPCDKARVFLETQQTPLSSLKREGTLSAQISKPISGHWQLKKLLSEKSIGLHLQLGRLNENGIRRRSSRDRRSSEASIPSSTNSLENDTLTVALLTAMRKVLLDSEDMYYQIPRVLPHLIEINLLPGDFLCRQDEAIQHVYIIQHGYIEVQWNEGKLKEVGPGTLLGEVGICFPEAVYPYSYVASSCCQVQAIAKKSFSVLRHIASPSSHMYRVLFLHRMPALASYTPIQLQHVAAKMDRRVIDSSESRLLSSHFIGAHDQLVVLIEKGKLRLGNTLIEQGRGFTSYDLDPSIREIVALETQVIYSCITKVQLQNLLSCELPCPLSLQIRQSVAIKGEIDLADLAHIAVIGNGSIGKVSMVQHQPSRQVFALKRMSKNLIVELGQLKQVFNEKQVLQTLHHPLLLHLYATYQDPTYIYLLTEVAHGGDLWHIIYSNPNQRLDLSTTQFYAANIVLMLSYLQEHDIVYRDLKPENLVLDNRGYLKLIDFGFAKCLSPEEDTQVPGTDTRCSTLCGTPSYLAPEFILGESYGLPVDYWAFGIVLNEMLDGSTPFDPVKAQDDPNCDEDPSTIFANVLAAETQGIPFSKNMRKNFPVAKKLIEQLLQFTPNKRLGCGKSGISELQDHSFFKIQGTIGKSISFDWEALEQKRIPAPFVPSLKNDLDTSYFHPDNEDMEEIRAPDKSLATVFDGF